MRFVYAFGVIHGIHGNQGSHAIANDERCAMHGGADAEARCVTCGRPLCSSCTAFESDDALACGACENTHRSAGTTRIATAMVFASVVFLSSIGVALAQWRLTHQAVWWSVAAGGVAVLFAFPLATWALRPEYKPRSRIDVRRIEEGPSALGGGPYRVPAPPRRRLVARALAPAPLSGKGTAAVLGAAMLLTALTVPFAIHQPSWIDFEVVLGGFWVATTGTLAFVLYRGTVSDDYAAKSPRSWFGGNGPSWLSGVGDIGSGLGDIGGEGCAGAIAGIFIAIIAAVLFFVLAWIFVELLLPAMLFVTYTLLCGAIRHVTNDRHGCENKLGRSLAYGALWATAYLAPLGAVTWAVHAFLRAKHGI